MNIYVKVHLDPSIALAVFFTPTPWPLGRNLPKHFFLGFLCLNSILQLGFCYADLTISYVFLGFPMTSYDFL
jgi:hypothetical protein